MMFRLVRPNARVARQYAIVILGTVLCQGLVHRSSVLGDTVPLPLTLLTQRDIYLVMAPPSDFGNDWFFSDSVLNYEYSRRFTADEYRAGRVPVWDPNSYGGVPFTHYGKYSPFNAIYFLFPSPRTLVWMDVAKALVAALGAFVFFRRVAVIRFWPAAVGAWCYPLTGFFVLWQCFPISFVVAWFPALLAAVAMAVGNPRGWGAFWVSVFTLLTIVSGHADVGAQVLVASGLFGIGCLWRAAARRTPGLVRKGGLALGVGWGAGMALSAPYLLPLVEYSASGQRIQLRERGREERPPGTPEAVLLVLCPDWNGSHRSGSVYFATNNQIESASGAWVGLIATLAVAPLAFRSRARRGLNGFWLVSAVLGSAWAFGLPVFVYVLRLRGFNMVSHNRFVFLTGFSLLALAVTGLNAAWCTRGTWRRSGWVPVGALCVVGVLFVARYLVLPQAAEEALKALPTPTADAHRGVLARTYLEAAGWCALGLLFWGAIRSDYRPKWAVRGAAALMLAEVISFAHGYNPEVDVSLYYPGIPALERVKAAGDGRVLPLSCLPANLPQRIGLRDIRGYDGIDPRPVLELLDAVRAPEDPSPSYARSQFYLPLLDPTVKSAPRLPPALDMMNVRYIVTPGRFPTANSVPDWESDGYAVYRNSAGLPRAFIPKNVSHVPAEAERLSMVASPQFAAASVSYVAAPVTVSQDVEGAATVEDLAPGTVRVRASASARGLLVLADQWSEGWTAEVDGEPAPVVRVNHAVRGVVIPAGQHTVVFRYWPPGLSTGLRCALAGAVVLMGWGVFHSVQRSGQAR